LRPDYKNKKITNIYIEIKIKIISFYFNTNSTDLFTGARVRNTVLCGLRNIY